MSESPGLRIRLEPGDELCRMRRKIIIFELADDVPPSDILAHSEIEC